MWFGFTIFHFLTGLLRIIHIFQITCTLSDGSGGRSYNTSTNDTSYLIESLAIDTVYLCTVRALLMSGGYGESSEVITINTALATSSSTPTTGK